MLTSIKGYYEKGQVVLSEQPPLQEKTEVIVTFLADQNKLSNKPKRILGGLKGKIVLDDKFDEPLDELKEYM